MEPFTVFYQNHPITVQPRISQRARQMQLKVKTRHTELVLPKCTPLTEGKAFVQQHLAWLHHTLAQCTPPLAFLPGAVIPIEDTPVTLEHSQQLRGRIHYAENRLILPGSVEDFPNKVTRFLQARCREAITCCAREHAPVLNVHYQSIRLKDTSSRWGSCSAKGNLNLSWRLIMAPREVLRYVVIHELCHLLEMNHSARFWEHVASQDPHYRRHRQWLRQYGDHLLSIGTA